MANDIREIASLVVKACNSNASADLLTTLLDVFGFAQTHDFKLSIYEPFCDLYSKLSPSRISELGGCLSWQFYNERTKSLISRLDINLDEYDVLIRPRNRDEFNKAVIPSQEFLNALSPEDQKILLVKLAINMRKAHHERFENGALPTSSYEIDWFVDVLDWVNKKVDQLALNEDLEETFDLIIRQTPPYNCIFPLYEGFRLFGVQWASDVAERYALNRSVGESVDIMIPMLAKHLISPTDAAAFIFAFNTEQGHIPKVIDDSIIFAILRYGLPNLVGQQDSPLYRVFVEELPTYLSSDPELDAGGLPAILVMELHKLGTTESGSFHLEHKLHILYEQMIDFCSEHPNSVSMAFENITHHLDFSDNFYLLNVLPNVKERDLLINILIEELTNGVVDKKLTASFGAFAGGAPDMSHWPDYFTQMVATRLELVFDKPNVRQVVEDHSGIFEVFAKRAEIEQWPLSKRTEFAKRSCSAPVCLALIKALSIPDSEFHRFPNGVRRLLLINDLEL